jgi:hypothetical protein
MLSAENDPDILQLLDELEADWVKLWCKAMYKTTPVKTTHLSHK